MKRLSIGYFRRSMTLRGLSLAALLFVIIGISLGLRRCNTHDGDEELIASISEELLASVKEKPRASASKSPKKVEHRIDTDKDDVPNIPCITPRDTITGRFRRGIVDTLICEPICEPDTFPWGYEWWHRIIRSVKGSVADIPLHNWLLIRFWNAGDLDGNGTDEICIYPANYSTFAHYDIITYRSCQWHMMIEEGLEAKEDIMPAFKEFVSKSNKKGYIKAKVARNIYANADSTDWLGVECVDSLVRIKRNGEVYYGSRPYQAYF